MKQQKVQHELEDEQHHGETTSHFKARAMPNYRFFKIKQLQQETESKKIVFKEFHLATTNIKKSISEEEQEIKFHAIPMPDFNKLKPSVKKETASLTKAEPF